MENIDTIPTGEALTFDSNERLLIKLSLTPPADLDELAAEYWRVGILRRHYLRWHEFDLNIMRMLAKIQATYEREVKLGEEFGIQYTKTGRQIANQHYTSAGKLAAQASRYMRILRLSAEKIPTTSSLAAEQAPTPEHKATEVSNQFMPGVGS